MTRRYAGLRQQVQYAVGVCLWALWAAVAVPVAAQAQAQAPAPRTVLVMGDSLSAAYGLAASQGWVALTAQRMRQRTPGWTIANASISGETTAGGASRIGAELKRHRPALVVIELGANDGLRGLPLAQSRANLEKMILAAQDDGARVLLVGMRIPPNYGRDYAQQFQAMFKELAAQHGTAYLPFLLEPIVANRDNFQDDNLHPVAAAQPALRDHVWQALEPLLGTPSAPRR